MTRWLEETEEEDPATSPEWGDVDENSPPNSLKVAGHSARLRNEAEALRARAAELCHQAQTEIERARHFGAHFRACGRNGDIPTERSDYPPKD